MQRHLIFYFKEDLLIILRFWFSIFMKTLGDLKKSYLYYTVILICFFIVFTNSYDKTTNFNISPIYSFQLPDFFLFLIYLVISFSPYIFIFALIYFIVARYTHKIKRIQFLTVVRGAIVIFLVFLFLLLLLSLARTNVQNPTRVPPLQVTSQTTTTALSSSTSYVANNNIEVINLIFILIAASILVLILFSTRTVLKNEEIIKKKIKKVETVTRTYDPIKNDIIRDYLKMSEYLESKGIDPDFSLTPVEFDNDTRIKLKLKEFEIITYYYELSRFSEQPLSEEDYKTFQNYLDILYKKVDALNKEKTS